MDPWEDLDEAIGTASGDPALELVLRALVEMTNHAEVAAVGMIDPMDGKGVVGDVQIDVLIVEVDGHQDVTFLQLTTNRPSLSSPTKPRSTLPRGTH